MTRSTPRNRRRATVAATPSDNRPSAAFTGNGSTDAVETMADGWQRTLDITRAVWGASLGTSLEWMRGLGELQQAQAAALRQAGDSIDELATRAEHAPDWPALWAVQASLAGAQWTRAMEGCSELFGQVMQIETRLVERSRADAARLSQRWLGELNGHDEADRSDASDTANAPLAMLAQAQATMSEMSRLWAPALYQTSLPE